MSMSRVQCCHDRPAVSVDAIICVYNGILNLFPCPYFTPQHVVQDNLISTFTEWKCLPLRDSCTLPQHTQHVFVLKCPEILYDTV